MRLRILNLVIIITISLGKMYGQYPGWQNIVSSQVILCVAAEGDIWWIGTDRAGLIEYNSVTHEKKLYDKANSPLKSSTITSIAVTSDGTKWIGTEDAGLYKLQDNILTQEKINNKILSARIIDLYVDKEGVLWMGSDGLYRLKNNIWTVQSKANQSLPFAVVSKIQKDNDGTLWLAGDNKISRLDGTTWITYTSANIGLAFSKINKIYIDSKNNKWFATNTGLIKYDDMAWTVYKSSNSGLPYDEVGGITASEDGKIWVSTRVGVASFDGSVWKNYTIENERNINVVPQSIFWINQKYLLTSTSNSGFYQFDQDKWQKVDISFNPLGSLYTEQLFADHQSNIWLANGSYLHRYNESGWQSYLLPDKFIGSNLTAIKEDKSGKIWISKYGSGIASFDNGQFTLYDLLVLGFTPNVSLLGFDSDDNLWAATSSNGLIKFDGTAWTKVDKSNSGLPSNSVNSMALDSKGKKWFGTSEGLATFDDTTWVVYNTSNSSIPSNSVGDIHILPNDDIVLIASNNIFQFDGTTWKKFPTAFVNSFNSIITIMANSKSEFWSGMTSGLVSFMGTTVTEYSTINSPLVDNNVRSIVFDKEDKIWALSDFGISIYNPNYKVSVDDPNLTNPLKIVKVHPNPTNCLFSISNKLPGQLRLYDISGQLMFEKQLKEYDLIDISQLEAGVYIGRLQSTNLEFNVFKIVKQ